MENHETHEHTHTGHQAEASGTTGQPLNPNAVVLDEPIRRGNSTITEITVRKPSSGELRGVTLMALADLDVVALQKVLPRVTTPTITAPEVANLEPSDLMQLGAKVASFLLPKADRAMVSPQG